MATIANVIQGLTILAKYEPDGEMSASHDEMHSAGPAPSKLTPKEVQTLEGCGWHWDEHWESWYKFT